MFSSIRKSKLKGCFFLRCHQLGDDALLQAVCKISWCPVNLFIIDALITFIAFSFHVLYIVLATVTDALSPLSQRLNIRSFGQRGHCLLVLIFFVEARQKLVLLGIYFSC